MATINVYLTFKCNCEEAFIYYKSISGGEFDHIGRFSDIPKNPNFSLSEDDKERIMYVSLPISKETYVMGSDIGGEWSANYKEGNNFSISINTESKLEFNG